MPRRGTAGGFYAVARGRRVGVYKTWPEAQAQVTGFSNALHRKFETQGAAAAWVAQHTDKTPPPAAPRQQVPRQGTADAAGPPVQSPPTVGSAQAPSAPPRNALTCSPPSEPPSPAQRPPAVNPHAGGTSGRTAGAPAVPTAPVATPPRPASAATPDLVPLADDEMFTPTQPAARKRRADDAIDVDADSGEAEGGADALGTARPAPKRRRVDVLDDQRARDRAAHAAAAAAYPKGARCTLYFDGASKGNPGLSGAGCWLARADGTPLWELTYRLPHRATNNEAEYHALLIGLKRLAEEGRTNVHICGDSKLVLLQVQGTWQAHKQELRNLKDIAKKYIRRLETLGARVTFEHIRREHNSKADALANKACAM